MSALVYVVPTLRMEKIPRVRVLYQKDIVTSAFWSSQEEKQGAGEKGKAV